MELHPEVLQYLSVAMKMEVDSSVAEPTQNQEETHGESQRDDDDGGGGGEVADAETVKHSPEKRRKRRFQPKKSPKKKAKKVAKFQEHVEQGSHDEVPSG